MKNTFKITFILGLISLLSSCVNNNEPIIEYPEIGKGIIEEFRVEPIEEIVTNTGLLEGNTGNIDIQNSTGNLSDENTGSGFAELVVLSIEEQYCSSKGGKVVFKEDKKICFSTDNQGLLKCEISIFYQDKCRDELAIIEDEVVMGLKIEKPVEIIDNTGSLELLDDTTSDNITSIINTDIIKSNTKDIEKTEEKAEEKNKEVVIEQIIKEKQGKSGKYYILVGKNGSNDLRMISNEGNNISLLNGKNIYDYELMVNKQIKVFYYLPGNIKSEEIIDLNNI